jgi:hypothetical protein
MKYGVPIQVGGVAVDLLSARANNREDALENPRSSGVPVVPLPVLIYLKLKSPRPKDVADVMELIRLGIERDAIRADLVARSPELVEKWDRAVAEALARRRVGPASVRGSDARGDADGRLWLRRARIER